jgi:hypothetical protein
MGRSLRRLDSAATFANHDTFASESVDASNWEVGDVRKK